MLQKLAAMREEVLYMIFLGLHKAYDALDRNRRLKIQERYVMGPRACRILWMYWDRLRVVVRAGGYYEKAFKGFRGVTQGDPLSSTIFNLVVDLVVRHWVE